jgi:hypothetical protein
VGKRCLDQGSDRVKDRQRERERERERERDGSWREIEWPFK